MNPWNPRNGNPVILYNCLPRMTRTDWSWCAVFKRIARLPDRIKLVSMKCLRQVERWKVLYIGLRSVSIYHSVIYHSKSREDYHRSQMKPKQKRNSSCNSCLQICSSKVGRGSTGSTAGSQIVRWFAARVRSSSFIVESETNGARHEQKKDAPSWHYFGSELWHLSNSCSCCRCCCC